MPSAASHSISDIIDSYLQQQHVTSQQMSSVASDNTGQLHDNDAQSFLAVSDRSSLASDQCGSDQRRVRPEQTHRQLRPDVIVTDENDGNYLNVLHATKPQYYTSAAWQQDIHNDPPTERSTSQQFAKHSYPQAVHAKVVTWPRSVDSERAQIQIFPEHASTLRYTSDGGHTAIKTAGSRDRQDRALGGLPLRELVFTEPGTYAPKMKRCETLKDGRQAFTDSTLPHQSATAAAAARSQRSHSLHYSTALESTGQSFSLSYKLHKLNEFLL